MTAVINGSEVELDRDRSLVELHQAGDDAAFTQLYALHYGRLVRFCYRLTRDSHAAEEVAQEAFTRAFGSMDRLRGERRFYPWLTVIARRLVIDRARDRGRVEVHAHLEAEPSRAAEDIAVQRIDVDHVATAFGRLSERHQDVLRLRDWEGLSYDAIAERLGVPSTTVPSLLHRARTSLRREYLTATRSRVAAWLHLAPLIAAARRLRDRAVVWASHLPDPAIFAAPMAGAVLGAAALLAPQAMQQTAPAGVQLDAPSGALHIPNFLAPSGASLESPAQGDSHAKSRPYNEHPLNPQYKLRDAGFRPEETALRHVIRSDPDTYESDEEALRRKPIFFQEEQTGIGIAADPRGVRPYVERTLGR